MKGPTPASDWVQSDATYSQIAGVDPYVEWSLSATGRPYFFLQGRQDRWMPILIRLREITARDFAAGTFFVDDARSLALWHGSIRVSPLYTNRAEKVNGDIYTTALVRQGFFEFLRHNEKIRQVVVRVTLGLPLDGDSLPTNDAGMSAGREP